MKKIKIRPNPNQQVFFTSDTHWFHERAINFVPRPFGDVDEMNQALIDNWNREVTDKDIIFHLGDIGWVSETTGWKKLVPIFKQLHGQVIYIVPGNHDSIKNLNKLAEQDSRIKILNTIEYVRIYYSDDKCLKLCLSHYPLMTWAQRDKSTYQLFGHIHSYKGIDEHRFDQGLPLYPYQYDVGVDNNNYKPVSVEDIIKLLNITL